MTEMFTIELSEEATRHAQEVAARTGRSIEAILSEWIEHTVHAEEIYPLIPNVEYPIYTEFGNEAAAAVLMELLNEVKDARVLAGKLN